MLRKVLDLGIGYRGHLSGTQAKKTVVAPKRLLRQKRGNFRYKHQQSWSVGGPDYVIPRTLPRGGKRCLKDLIQRLKLENKNSDKFMFKYSEPWKVKPKSHRREFGLLFGAILILGGGYYLSAPTVEVPVTGRKYRRLVPREISNWIEVSMIESILDEYEDSILPSDHPLVRQVQSIGNIITDANGLERHTYIVIDSDEVNAFVAGGNIVFVYTGILPVLENPSGTAMVLGHEMGHVQAGHTNEGMTMLAVTLAISLALSIFGPGSDVAAGLWSLFVQLPKQRDAELEADLIGYSFMSNAGFDRREAVRVFERMRDATEGENEEMALEFIRTHPVWYKRIDLLNECLENDTRPVQWVRLPATPPPSQSEFQIVIVDDDEEEEDSASPTSISSFAPFNPITKASEWLSNVVNARVQTKVEAIMTRLSQRRNPVDKKVRYVDYLKAITRERLNKSYL